MAIDAVIAGVRYGKRFTTVVLRQRTPDQPTGADRLELTLNPDYTPQLRDAVWGNGSILMIGGHEFGRIRTNYNGVRYVDYHPRLQHQPATVPEPTK